MDRKQLIGVLLATLLVIANVVVWFLHRQPPSRLADNREILRDQRMSEWEAMPAASLDEVASTLALMFGLNDSFEESPNIAGYAAPVSFRTLARANKTDLIETIGGAVSAIAANDPSELVAYMADRGLEPNLRRLSGQLRQVDGGAHLARIAPSKQLAALWELLSVDPHWGNWVPEATSIRVWKPRSIRNVSVIQLGQTESWLWGKDIVYTSMFRARPTFVQSIFREPVLLADVRILIEFDDSLKRERSPYFFRFWRSEEQAKWQPLALKLVRTKNKATDSIPQIIF